MNSFEIKNNNYRPDIDGLRAIAILLVVAYHAFPTFLPGGFIGVDVFFVISGFLITSTILNELHAGRFSFTKFYARRFRRIVPALFLVLSMTWVAGYFLLSANDFIRLGKHLVGGATFTSNILLKNESGYFDQSSELKPFLHLWSLGLEEQFYLIWPVLLMIIPRKRRSLVTSTVILMVGSFVINIYLIQNQKNTAFYLLPSRFWELLVGAGLAIGLLNNQPKFGSANSVFRSFLSVIAVALLAVSAVFFNKGTLFPSWFAIAPTLAAALIILSGPETWFNRVLLSSRSAVFFGLISYPLYLWHWPLLSFARILSEDGLVSISVIFILIVFSGVLAYVTRKFIERPVQSFFSFGNVKKFATPPWAIALTLGASFFLTLIGFATYRGRLISFDEVRYPLVHKLEKSSDFNLDLVRIGKCFLDTSLTNQNFDPVCTNPTDHLKKVVLLLGDSHAAHLYPGLKQVLDGSHIDLLQLNGSSCPPFFPFGKKYSETCEKVREYALVQVKQIKPATVILAARWESYYQDKDFEEVFSRTLRELFSSGVKNILIIGPTPSWVEPLPKLLAKKFVRTGRLIPPRMNLELETPTETFSADRSLNDFSIRNQLHFVSITDHLCNSDGCLTQVGDNTSIELMNYDKDHLTLAGSRYIANSIIKRVLIDLKIMTTSPSPDK